MEKQILEEELESLRSEWSERLNMSEYRDYSNHALLGRLYHSFLDYKKLDKFWGYNLPILPALSALLADRSNCESEILRRMEHPTSPRG